MLVKPSLLLIVVVLVSVVVPGCLTGGSPQSKASDIPSSSTSSTPASVAPTNTSENATGAPDQTNHPPTANLTASVSNGSAPLMVNFTLSAADMDGDNLTFTFQPLGNGTSSSNGSVLPTNVTYTYSTPGSYNATLTVSDGMNTTTTTVLIVANVGALPVVFKGHIYAPDPQASTSGECLYPLLIVGGAPSGVAGTIHSFPHPLDGWKYSFGSTSFMAMFWKGSSAITGHGSSGSVPAGTTEVWVCTTSPTTANADYTLTILPA